MHSMTVPYRASISAFWVLRYPAFALSKPQHAWDQMIVTLAMGKSPAAAQPCPMFWKLKTPLISTNTDARSISPFITLRSGRTPIASITLKKIAIIFQPAFLKCVLRRYSRASKLRHCGMTTGGRPNGARSSIERTARTRSGALHEEAEMRGSVDQSEHVGASPCRSTRRVLPALGIDRPRFSDSTTARSKNHRRHEQPDFERMASNTSQLRLRHHSANGAPASPLTLC